MKKPAASKPGAASPSISPVEESTDAGPADIPDKKEPLPKKPRKAKQMELPDKEERPAKKPRKAKQTADEKSTFARRYCPKAGRNRAKWLGLREVYEGQIAQQLPSPSKYEELLLPPTKFAS